MRCPFCDNQQVDTDSLFCTKCGSRLRGASASLDTDRLKMLGGESRLLTSVFVNFRGFDQLIKEQGPIKGMIYIRECLMGVEEIIRSFDGTTDLIYPDSRVLGIFGAPKAHKDDPIRTTRCAFQIRNWWSESKDNKDFLDKVDIAIGVNTGRAFFAYILEEPSFLTVIGDTVNTAARLTEISPPGEILLSEDTYDRITEYVNARHMGERFVKGKRKKVSVYILEGIKEEPKVLTTQQMPFFGRMPDLDKLVNAAEKVKNKKLAFITIAGQMGIGKTRLKEEFEKYLSNNESFHFMETHCTAEMQSPYYPFRFLFRNYFSLNESETDEVVASKIDKFVGENGLKPTDAKGIKHLFLTDINRLRSDEMRLINEEIYSSIKNFVKNECQERPFVMIFEEFNKADTMSRSLVAYLLSELQNEALMFLMVNATSEFASNLDIPIFVEEVNIKPLSLEETGELIRCILRNVDDKLVEFIYQAAGGNPLFTIEAIRNTRRTKVIKEISGKWYVAKEQRLPFLDDLYGVVMSTIDSLPSDYRLIIDYASVIGYSFNLRILQGLLERPHLGEQLDYLASDGYIILSKDAQDPVYVFRHSLLKDAAYTVLPLRKRKEIHRRIADLFENIYGNQLSNFYESVAHHYFSSENFKKAAKYYKLAGDKSKNLYAIEQAFEFYNMVLKLKKEVADQIPPELVRSVFLNMSDLYEISGDIQRMEKISKDGLVDAQRDNDLESEIAFTERNGSALTLLNKFKDAEELLLAGVQKCDEKFPFLLTTLYSDLGYLYVQKNEYEKSILYFNLSWNTARAHQLEDGELLCLLNISELHRNLGNYEQASEYLNYGLEKLQSSERRRQFIQFNYLAADINYQIWNLEEAKKLLLDCYKIAEEIGTFESAVKAALGLAVIFACEENFSESDKYLQFVDKEISFFIREDLLAEINYKKAQIFYCKHDHKKVLDFATSALKIAEKFNQREDMARCYWLLSIIDKENALKHAKKAHKLGEDLKLQPLIATILYRLAEIYKESSDDENARYYGRKALLMYDDLKSKLKDENRQHFTRKPEYMKLLEV
jgi:class 3 adenylate cyclase